MGQLPADSWQGAAGSFYGTQIYTDIYLDIKARAQGS